MASIYSETSRVAVYAVVEDGRYTAAIVHRMQWCPVLSIGNIYYIICLHKYPLLIIKPHNNSPEKIARYGMYSASSLP
jgi:hypothetical protein